MTHTSVVFGRFDDSIATLFLVGGDPVEASKLFKQAFEEDKDPSGRYLQRKRRLYPFSIH